MINICLNNNIIYLMINVMFFSVMFIVDISDISTMLDAQYVAGNAD